jgi:hypothetical protein
MASVAEQLWIDRIAAHKSNQYAPGQAEYLDIIRALSKMGNTPKKQLEVLEKISQFSLRKYPQESKKW